MKSLNQKGMAGGRSIGFMIMFGLVIAGIFVMNHWIKNNLAEESPAVSVPNTSPYPVSEPKENMSGIQGLDLPPVAEQLSESARSQQTSPAPPPQEEIKIIYETPLNSTILVQ